MMLLRWLFFFFRRDQIAAPATMPRMASPPINPPAIAPPLGFLEFGVDTADELTGPTEGVRVLGVRIGVPEAPLPVVVGSRSMARMSVAVPQPKWVRTS